MSKKSGGRKEKSSLKGGHVIAENRKANFNYAIEEKFEAGLVLWGTEVKSCRDRKVTLTEAYAAFKKDELYLVNAHINEFKHGNRFNHDVKRDRKLLMKKKELEKLKPLLQSGLSLVPLKMYFKNSYVKVSLGLGKGKKSFDKRESLKKKDAEREIARRFRK